MGRASTVLGRAVPASGAARFYWVRPSRGTEGAGDEATPRRRFRGWRGSAGSVAGAALSGSPLYWRRCWHPWLPACKIRVDRRNDYQNGINRMCRRFLCNRFSLTRYIQPISHNCGYDLQRGQKKSLERRGRKK